MIIDAHEAWILHRQSRGETSVQITLFTSEQGIVQAVYKGGRTPKKQAYIQPFTPLWVLVATKNQWSYIRQLEMSSAAVVLIGDALFGGLYINELLFNVLKPGDSQLFLFDLYKETLQQLAMTQDKLEIERVLRVFENHLLSACGYEVSYLVDSEGHSIKNDIRYQWVPGEGFCRQENGWKGDSLLNLAEQGLQGKEELRIAKQIMRSAIDHMLEGKKLKTRELYRKTIILR